jgi:hypothetical protein
LNCFVSTESSVNPANNNNSLQARDSEDEESSPIIPQPEYQSVRPSEFSPVDNHTESAGSSRNDSSYSGGNEIEGDITGNVEQWVLSPGRQGVLYKCRITRDRKGMDKGLFPIYYLHLERDTGKKVFLLAGKDNDREVRTKSVCAGSKI